MKIFYTGLGSNATGEHSIQEFMNIMNNNFILRNWTPYEREYYYTIPALKFRRFKLPEEFLKFTIHDWINYAGAVILYSGDEHHDICTNCGKTLFIKNNECVNCEYIQFINLNCDEIFEPLDFSDSCN
jgi:hypothetical protein